MTPNQNFRQRVLRLSLGIFLVFVFLSIITQTRYVHAAPLAVPPIIGIVGSCDIDGNSIFTITNTGGAMTSNYTWEIYQESIFLTSGPFSLTASGTTGDTLSLTINGLYGNLMVAVKDGTTSSAVQIASDTAFCENHPKVTVKQATGQPDPALSSPILFTVVFASSVTGFDASDVTISGMAGTPGISVTGSGSTYTVAVTGMVIGETVTATVGANVALSTGNGGGYGNQSSTSNTAPQDNKVTYLGPPIIGIAGSCDTNGNSTFIITNTGGPMTSNYTWEIYQESIFLTSGPFSLTASGTTGDTLSLSINGLYGNLMVAVKDGTTSSAVQIASDTAFCENHPKVTVKQAVGQLDPTNSSPILFTVAFASSVTGFDASDVTISGMAATPGITVTGSGSTYTVAVTGMANNETVTATIGANVALSTGNGGGYGNQSSTSNTAPQDNKVTYDLNGPTVTINQASGQADPANSSPINFDIVFSESVTSFGNTDVKISGMAGTPVINVTDSGDHIHFTAAVTGMASGETITATIPAYAALNAGGHGSFASTSTDNKVTYDALSPTVTINQGAGQADPTSTSPIKFDVVFNEAVTGFVNTDVTILGMAASPGITVTDSGDHIHFTVSVTGMADGETITASLPANASTDLAGNLSLASTSTDNNVTYDLLPSTVTINQAAGQADPASSSPINFDVVFDEAMTGFINTDVSISGMAGTPSITVTDSGNHIHFTVAVTGMADGETITATIPASIAKDSAGNDNTASTSTDNVVTYDTNAPTVTATTLLPTYTSSGPSSFTVTFSDDVNNPSGDSDAKDVTNPANYLLINKGANGIADTVSCLGGLIADDTQITITSVIYTPNTAIVSFGTTLAVGNYRLLVCGTTSIVDLAFNELGNGTDYSFDFVVNRPISDDDDDSPGSNRASFLPQTGFAPNQITSLPVQPANLAYSDLGSIWLEIPSQNIKTAIVGVPQSENNWDIKWLGNDVGWLNGTAFPSWIGNSVLTAHVTNADGLPGPFANLKDLEYGEQVIVHILDQQYIFEVRNIKLVRPETTAFAFEHLEGNSFLTLITCSGYNEQSDTYRLRRLIRAVLVSVK